MLKLPRAFRIRNVSTMLLIGMFLCVILLDAATVLSTSQYVLDSDSSAEMVLANHLYETGRFLSEDWFYSTEIRAVYTQLIFAPLFAVFESWHMVRFVGTMILHALYVLSYGYMVRKAGMSRKAFFIGAALLLLPVSVPYGRIVLYQVSYIMSLSFCFLMVGLLIALMKDWNRSKGLMIWHGLLLMALSFISALNGYRQLVVTHAPLMLVAFLFFCRADGHVRALQAIRMLVCIGLAAVAACGGLLVNLSWQKAYSFSDYSGLMLTGMEPERWVEMFYDILLHFGYRTDIGLMTPTGLVSVLSGVLGMFCLAYGARMFMRRELPSADGTLLVEYMFPSSMAVMLAVFILTKQNFAANRYFLPCTVWLIPILSLRITTLPDCPPAQKHPRIPAWLTAQKLVLYAICGLCLLNSLINIRSFTHPETFGQHYTGLEYGAADKVAQLSPVRDFLVENEYDLGYATYWNTNVLTEMSDGQLRMVCGELKGNNGLTWADWLSLKTNLTCESQKAFILLEPYEYYAISWTGLEPYVQQVYEDENYTVWEILDLQRARELIVKREK